MSEAFAVDERAQVSTEYLLLLALGLVIVIVGVALSLQLKSLADVVSARAASERNATIAMLAR